MVDRARLEIECSAQAGPRVRIPLSPPACALRVERVVQRSASNEACSVVGHVKSFGWRAIPLSTINI